jgi:hypothetical protein
MIVIMQCAPQKKGGRCLRRRDGAQIKFVADPAIAPPTDHHVYARPDDPSDRGPSWRELLIDYNENPGNNPLGLYPAFQLYQNEIYRELVDCFGLDKTFILSAGWGLIRASFLTPWYDITFTQAVKTKAPYKLRKKTDQYDDLCMLPPETGEPVTFIGGKDYLPLFCRLTQMITAPRAVFYYGAQGPKFPGVTFVRYPSARPRRWFYDCAQDLIAGRIVIPA